MSTSPEPKHPFARESLAPNWRRFGLDSVQGYLEIGEWYATDGVFLNFDPQDGERFNSMYFQLRQLEKEGYLQLHWEPRADNVGISLVKLNQAALTTSGRKLLDELRLKSRWGRLRKRAIDLTWIATTSIVTTLMTLSIKGF